MAQYHGASKAAQQLGVSKRTIYRWKKEARESDELAKTVRAVKRDYLEGWLEQFGPFLIEAAQFLRESLDELDPGDREDVHQVTGSISQVADILLTKDMLDAENHPPNAEDQELRKVG